MESESPRCGLLTCLLTMCRGNDWERSAPGGDNSSCTNSRSTSATLLLAFPAKGPAWRCCWSLHPDPDPQDTPTWHTGGFITGHLKGASHSYPADTTVPYVQFLPGFKQCSQIFNKASVPRPWAMDRYPSVAY